MGRTVVPDYVRDLQRRCMHPSGCKEDRYRERLCRKHYDALQAYFARHASPQCRAPRCEKPGIHDGYCALHAPAQASKPKCSEPGCGKPRSARGLCAMHYQRWKRTDEGQATLAADKQSGAAKTRRAPDTRATRRTCSVDGCERPHRARGFCAAHYKASLRARKRQKNQHR